MSRQANLKYLLNQWGPLGVADIVDDEYDCLLAPLWLKLIDGADAAAIREFLWYGLADHFGLDPTRVYEQAAPALRADSANR